MFKRQPTAIRRFFGFSVFETAIKAILFDVDGVLIESDDAVASIFQDALERFAGVKPSKERLLRFAGMATLPWLNAAAPKANAAAVAKAAAWATRVYWRDYMPERCKALPGVAKALRALKRRGVKLGIVSNQTRREIRVAQRIIGFNGFDAVVSREDAAPKPSPAGLRKALRALGVKPGEALYVGDTVVDARTCAPLGVRLVLITRRRNKNARELCGVPRLKRFSELLGFVEGENK